MNVELTRAAQGRAKIYLWLSSAFLNEPTAEKLERLLSEQILQTMQQLLPESTDIPKLRDIRTKLKTSKAKEIGEEFERLFVVPNRQMYVPPYESCFKERTGNDYGNIWGMTTLEVNALYQKGGFEAKLGDRSAAPDHIGLEFAFLSALCLREMDDAAKKDDSVVKIRDLQRHFVDSHLARWLPAFAKTIRARSRTGFYASVASIAETFLKQDRFSSLSEGQ